MDRDAFPIIRLEVQGMKLAILHAFTEQIGNIDKDVKAAIERFCTPANITAIVTTATTDIGSYR